MTRLELLEAEHAAAARLYREGAVMGNKYSGTEGILAKSELMAAWVMAVLNVDAE